jgi:hypothetical protein
LLYALLGGVQGWAGAVVIWMSYTLFFQLWHSWASWESSWSNPALRLQWFYFLINGSRTTALAFALLTLGAGTYGLWQAVNRRFRNPDLTLLSKRQSYGMTLCLEVWLIGFVFQNFTNYDRPFEYLIWLGFCNLLWFMVLFAALTPQRQMLIDWARYRRERATSARQFWSRSIVKDLLWNEKSPALVAIALNLLIAAVVVVPWILSWQRYSSPRQGLATIVLGSTFTLICAAIAQLMMFMKSPKRGVWAAGTVAAVVILPPVVLSVLQLSYTEVPLAWLFSIGAFTVFQQGVSMTTAFTAFLGHLGILSLLSLRLTRQLKRAGESEMKALLAASRG